MCWGKQLGEGDIDNVDVSICGLISRYGERVVGVAVYEGTSCLEKLSRLVIVLTTENWNLIIQPDKKNLKISQNHRLETECVFCFLIFPCISLRVWLPVTAPEISNVLIKWHWIFKLKNQHVRPPVHKVIVLKVLVQFYWLISLCLSLEPVLREQTVNALLYIKLCPSSSPPPPPSLDLVEGVGNQPAEISFLFLFCKPFVKCLCSNGLIWINKKNDLIPKREQIKRCCVQ